MMRYMDGIYGTRLITKLINAVAKVSMVNQFLEYLENI